MFSCISSPLSASHFRYITALHYSVTLLLGEGQEITERKYRLTLSTCDCLQNCRITVTIFKNITDVKKKEIQISVTDSDAQLQFRNQNQFQNESISAWNWNQTCGLV